VVRGWRVSFKNGWVVVATSSAKRTLTDAISRSAVTGALLSQRVSGGAPFKIWRARSAPRMVRANRLGTFSRQSLTVTRGTGNSGRGFSSRARGGVKGAGNALKSLPMLRFLPGALVLLVPFAVGGCKPSAADPAPTAEKPNDISARMEKLQEDEGEVLSRRDELTRE